MAAWKQSFFCFVLEITTALYVLHGVMGLNKCNNIINNLYILILLYNFVDARWRVDIECNYLKICIRVSISICTYELINSTILQSTMHLNLMFFSYYIQQRYTTIYIYTFSFDFINMVSHNLLTIILICKYIHSIFYFYLYNLQIYFVYFLYINIQIYNSNNIYKMIVYYAVYIV